MERWKRGGEKTYWARLKKGKRILAFPVHAADVEDEQDDFFLSERREAGFEMVNAQEDNIPCAFIFSIGTVNFF